MKWIYVVLCVVICGTVMGSELYSDIYDTIDVDAILKSDRLSNQYIACLLDKGPCTADGRSLKHIIPDAIATQCQKCTDKQQQIAKKIFNHVKNNRPDAWTSILDKYDPEREYAESFEEFLKQK